jgi:hypothetical protein
VASHSDSIQRKFLSLALAFSVSVSFTTRLSPPITQAIPNPHETSPSA